MSAQVSYAPLPAALARAGFLLVCLSLLGACSELSTTQERVLSSAAIGAGVGAATTIMTGGCISCGTVIGGAVGAGAGYVYDMYEKDKLF